MAVAIFFLWSFGAAAAGAWIGYRVKGRPLTGFLLGIFLGWIGVGILALLPPAGERAVEREVRRQAIADEAARRRMGAQPWNGSQVPVTPDPASRPEAGSRYQDLATGQIYRWAGDGWEPEQPQQPVM